MPRLNRLLFKSGSKGQAGFTLIEVLIALTIFAVGLLALAGMQVTGIRGNAQAHSVMAKVAVADGIIEEYLALSSDDPVLQLSSVDEEYLWPTGDNTLFLPGGGTLRASVSITPDPTISGNNYADLTLVSVVVSSNMGNDVVKTVMKRRR